ncbi:hypothetical protein BD779DRAFT_1476556 [Infundibulicybe gibba]|nr:hypothetical protein BD779DRAFT_1476556 [Infundibulicybe gibba]
MPDVGKQQTGASDTTFLLRFPPFPSPPEGVTIIPFKDFKECGIQMFNEDEEVEVDGLGIPTVLLTDRHDTDVCKTNAKRKRKQVAARSKSGFVRKEWWEQWEEGEDLRLTGGYDPNGNPIDHLFQAAHDFRVGRTWPPAQAGVQYLWDQFRLYIGLLSNTPIWQRTDKPAPAEDDDGDPSDDDDGPAGAAVPETSFAAEETIDPPKKFFSRIRPRPPYANYGEEGIPVDNDEAVRKLLEDANLRKEEQTLAFLSDPEHSIRVFLSSYMRKSTYERSFRRSLAVIDMAGKELPLTSRIAKLLPDNLAEACKACWGKQADGYKGVPPIQPAPIQPEGNEPKTDTDEKEVLVKEFEDVLKAGSVQLINVEDILPENAAKVIAEDNLDPETEIGNNWGDWGKDNSGNDAWGVEPADWDTPQPRFLMTLMGPTVALSSPSQTHHPAPEFTRKIASAGEGIPDPDPDSVELELERRFTKVVMEPWIDWDTVDDSKPTILETSRGTTENEAGPGVPSPAENATPDGLKAHNRYKDDIIALMEPTAAAPLCLGMGLGGTWVQLVRPYEIGMGDPPAKKKKKKGKSKKAPERFWYLEELMLTLPSYYTIGDPP